MDRISNGIIALLFLIGGPTAIPSDGPAKIRPKVSTATASLDTLVSRVDGYWSALLRKKKQQAAEYVSDADRDKFYNSNFPSFSDPHLKSLELSVDRKEAMVTVIVTRTMPPLGIKTDWPVTDRWRFENGDWYRTVPSKSPFVLPGMERAEKLTGEEVEALQNKVRKLLVFEKTVLDFGTVQESTPLQLSLKYTLGGDKPLGAIINAPAGFGVQGGSEQVINPGDHELRITIPTWQLDGVVNEHIIMTVRQPGVAVPFEIEVKGNVYVPVSIVPKRLKFRRDEREKEVRIRNNSKSDLEILPVYSETRQVQLQPIPVSVLPGQEIVMKVTLGSESGLLPSNQTDSLAIPFAKPVDGVNALSLSVVLNAADAGKNGEASGAKEEIPLLFRTDKAKGCQGRPAIK